MIVKAVILNPINKISLRQNVADIHIYVLIWVQ